MAEETCADKPDLGGFHRRRSASFILVTRSFRLYDGLALVRQEPF
jgi:hypothetical protein